MNPTFHFSMFSISALFSSQVSVSLARGLLVWGRLPLHLTHGLASPRSSFSICSCQAAGGVWRGTLWAGRAHYRVVWPHRPCLYRMSSHWCTFSPGDLGWMPTNCIALWLLEGLVWPNKGDAFGSMYPRTYPLADDYTPISSTRHCTPSCGTCECQRCSLEVFGHDADVLHQPRAVLRQLGSFGGALHLLRCFGWLTVLATSDCFQLGA